MIPKNSRGSLYKTQTKKYKQKCSKILEAIRQKSSSEGISNNKLTNTLKDRFKSLISHRTLRILNAIEMIYN